MRLVANAVTLLVIALSSRHVSSSDAAQDFLQEDFSSSLIWLQPERTSEPLQLLRQALYARAASGQTLKTLIPKGAAVAGSSPEVEAPSAMFFTPSIMMDDPAVTNCTPSSITDFPPDLFTQEQRMAGAIVIHFAVIAYMCGIMGIVCDRYFVPSLEIISESLGLSSDVAGATFMAIGTSAPELFTSLIGSFITEGDIGVGTIVGSAVFNILGVTALIGLAVGSKSLKIDWFPITRDCLVYIISVALLVVVVADNYVSWYEGVGLLVFYIAYVTLMLFNRSIEKVAYRSVARFTNKSTLSETTSLLAEAAPPIDDGSDVVDGSRPIFEIPNGGFFSVMSWLLFLPANIVLALTIPDPLGRGRCLFPLTFIMSIVHIGLSSYVTVWMVTVAGYTFGIPDTIAGLTILAAGTSVPELFASVMVAKNGRGNMALCNLLGSNIFDILFCLGAPWLVKTLIAGREILIHSEAMPYTAITLLTTVVLLFTTMAVMKWRINFVTGLICLGLYAGFVTSSCLYEFLVFGFDVPC